MKLSLNTSVPARVFGLRKTVEIMADAGFTALDFSAFDEEFHTDAHDRAFYEEIRKAAEDKGLCFNQAHAPFASSFADEQQTEKRFAEIVTSMKHASYLGVPHIVVHPCQHLTYDEPGVPDALFEMNMDFYRRLIPYCEEYNIKVAVENMWQYPKMISHSTCSRPEEFVRYMDGLDSHFVACLDIGHAVLVREKPDDLIRALGKKYLQCLHVHDVNGIEDSHTLPYYGIVNWDRVAEALADIDYTGDLTYEAGSFFAGIPSQLWPHAMRYMADVGKYLIDKIVSYKKK